MRSYQFDFIQYLGSGRADLPNGVRAEWSNLAALEARQTLFKARGIALSQALAFGAAFDKV
ncbi:MAG: hypothetical protein ACP5VS_10270 [Desulfomonilaceae bacterium]